MSQFQTFNMFFGGLNRGEFLRGHRFLYKSMGYTYIFLETVVTMNG
jgi:hypothetical protein